MFSMFKKNYSTLSKMDEQTDLVLVCKVAFYQYYVSFFFFSELLENICIIFQGQG